MFIKLNSIYDLFSIIVVIANIYFLFNFNITILLGVLLCVFLQDFIKEITTGWYPSIFKRPNGATNCSVFNTGGLVDKKSGFPSGHVANISFIMNFLNQDNNNIFYTILYYIPIILVAISRYAKNCHNIIQILSGYLLGYILAIFFYRNNDSIKNYYERIYKEYFTKDKI